MMQKPPSLAFFVPAYNEADNLPNVVRGINDFCDASHIADRTIIVVDDGSSDHTDLVTKQLQRQYGIVAVKHPTNLGYGAALRTGLNEGVKTGHDWIAFCDGDGQFDPMDAKLLFEAAYSQDADVAIGIRERRADSWRRRIIGRIWHWLSSLILGYNATDVDCGFKLFSGRSIASIHQSLRGEHATISPEILTRLQRAGYKIVEESLPHYPRAHGSQTGTKLSVMLQSLVGLFKVRQITRKEIVVHDSTVNRIAA